MAGGSEGGTMDGTVSNATAARGRRVDVTYNPSGPADVDTRVAYAWLVPDATGAEIALQARFRWKSPLPSLRPGGVGAEAGPWAGPVSGASYSLPRW